MRSTCSGLESSASKMANFNPKTFEKKLKDMDLSQTSVQTVSLWIIHHKQNIKEILAVWMEQIKKVKPDRKMVLFYLANDVVQNCRKKSKELIVFFGKAFKEILPYLNDKKINGQVERVFKIWDERRVYEKEHLEKFKSLHSSGKKEKTKNSDEKKDKSNKLTDKSAEKPTKAKAASKPLPPDFKMSTVMNMIVSMKELESEIGKQESQMASLRVDASDLEAVKQVKDRSGVNKFVKEFEESKEKLDLHCNTMSRCINDKRVLIDMLYHSESYYDAAYEEAKVIVHAYKTFGSRLSSMKRKVESRVKKLESAWKKKQKEIEEKKASQPEYEVEPISDADEPNEFQPIGDLVKSGLDSLSKRKKANNELYNPEDPTCDNVNVLDMDLESDSDAEPPNGPLYDPSSVMYDPSDTAENSQTGAADGPTSGSMQINIPNPEDIFKNLVGQSDASNSQFPSNVNLTNEIPSTILTSFPQVGNSSGLTFSSGNSIEGNVQLAMTQDNTNGSQQQQLNTSKISSSTSSILVATEPSRTLISDAAMSPISEDSCPSPSPEGTPDGLVFEKETLPIITSSDALFTIQNDAFPNALPTTPLLPPVGGQFSSGEQLLPVVSDNWLGSNSSQQFQFDQQQNLQTGNLVDWSALPGNLPLADLQTGGSLGIGMPFQIAPATNEMPMPSQLLNQNMMPSNESIMQPGMQIQMPMQTGVIPVTQQLLPTAVDSTTPTLDESLQKEIHPADILSGLLKTKRKHKHDSSSSPDDVEHGKRSHSRSSRKSSSKKKRSHRHRHSKHRESSKEHSSSKHSSSRSKDKSSHRRSRSRSVGTSLDDSAHLEESQDILKREDSVSSFSNDLFDNSLSKSPKSKGLESINETNDVEEIDKKDKASNSEALEAKAKESGPNSDVSENRQPTIFDLRRNIASAAEKSKVNQTSKQDSTNDSIDAAKTQPSDNSGQLNSSSINFSAAQQAENGVGVINTSNQVESFKSSEPTFSSRNGQQLPVLLYNTRRSPTPEMDRFEQPRFDNSNLQQPPFNPQTSQVELGLPVPQFALDFQHEMQQGLLPTPIASQEFQPQMFQQQEILQVQSPPVHSIQSLLGEYRPPLQPGGLVPAAVQPDSRIIEQHMLRPERPEFHVGQQVFMQEHNVIEHEPTHKTFKANLPSNPDNFHADHPFARPERPLLQHNESILGQNRPSLRQERPPFRPKGALLPSPRAPFRPQGPQIRGDAQHGRRHEGIRSPRFAKQRSLDDLKSEMNSVENDAANVETDAKHELGSNRLNNDLINHPHDEQMNNFEEENAVNGISSPRSNAMQMRQMRPGHFHRGFPRGGPMHRGRFRNPEPNNFARGNRLLHPRMPRMGAPGNVLLRPRLRPPLRPRLPPGFSPRRPVF